MTQICFSAMPSEIAQRFREQGLDDYGQPVVRVRSKGDGAPCRHCLQEVEAGKDFLVLAYRPFEEQQAFAETGPVFLLAESCTRYQPITTMPAMFRKRKTFLLRAYDRNNRIIYGSASHLTVENLNQQAKQLLSAQDPAYLHLRSGLYNCFQCRIDRLDQGDHENGARPSKEGAADSSRGQSEGSSGSEGTSSAIDAKVHP